MTTPAFDLIVIGGGPGGYTAAFRAADLGLSVCLVDREKTLGGVCLNVGCIPSKTLLHPVALLEELKTSASMGLICAQPDINLDALRTHKEQIVGKLTTGLDSLCKARKITRMQGQASFLDGQRILIRDTSGATCERAYTNALIATGSKPFMPPGLPDDHRIWNSSDALSLPFIPQRFLIVGGGIIGLEMARIYSALGSAVTIIELQDQLIPPADKDLVQPLFLQLKKSYRLLLKTRMTSCQAAANGIEVGWQNDKAEQRELFDAVLIAAGRKPNTEGLDLANCGLSTTAKGFIEVDSQMRTKVSGIYALGDVIGEPMLAHKASHQGKIAAEVIAGHDASFAPKTIPSVAYTHPEIAWMGLTEKAAKEHGISYQKAKFPWGASGRALASGAELGVTKVLFAPDSGKILGAGICGLNAGELIHEAVLALEMGADFRTISKTVHAHPTLAETFAFAAEIMDGSITDMLPKKN